MKKCLSREVRKCNFTDVITADHAYLGGAISSGSYLIQGCDNSEEIKETWWLEGTWRTGRDALKASQWDPVEMHKTKGWNDRRQYN